MTEIVSTVGGAKIRSDDVRLPMNLFKPNRHVLGLLNCSDISCVGLCCAYNNLLHSFSVSDLEPNTPISVERASMCVQLGENANRLFCKMTQSTDMKDKSLLSVERRTRVTTDTDPREAWSAFWSAYEEIYSNSVGDKIVVLNVFLRMLFVLMQIFDDEKIALKVGMVPVLSFMRDHFVECSRNKTSDLRQQRRGVFCRHVIHKMIIRGDVEAVVETMRNDRNSFNKVAYFVNNDGFLEDERDPRAFLRCNNNHNLFLFTILTAMFKLMNLDDVVPVASATVNNFKSFKQMAVTANTCYQNIREAIHDVQENITYVHSSCVVDANINAIKYIIQYIVGFGVLDVVVDRFSSEKDLF